MRTRDELLSFVDSLIAEAESLKAQTYLGTHMQRQQMHVNVEPYRKWESSCMLLIHMLGDLGKPWFEILGKMSRYNLPSAIPPRVGALRSIAENIKYGRLARIEQLVTAETFANLLEQGEYLLEQRYSLAAGVIFRSVLEEKLRALCHQNGCEPEKNKPTISDYNSELYRAKVYDKIAMKQVDAMAAIGNAAAHNENPSFEDVNQFHANLLSFVSKFD